MTAAIAQRLADTVHDGVGYRIVGSGTWLDAGRPVTADARIDARDTRGIIEYVPGDLVMTVGAGTTLEEIQRETTRHNQWLALDPYGASSGSIGATVATASSGPLSASAGRVRDLVLGMRTLSSDGSAVSAGGRVVKNVAGFDLVRLATGAWGTLGVITAVSLRLHARPKVDETLVLALDRSVPLDMHLAKLAALQVASLGLLAIELVDASCLSGYGDTHGDTPGENARHEDDSDHPALLLLARLAGNRERVDYQRRVLMPVGRLVELHDLSRGASNTDAVHDFGSVSPFPWNVVRTIDGTAASNGSSSHDGGTTAVARITAAPTALAATLTEIRSALREVGLLGVHLVASPLTGSVRVVIPVYAAGDANLRAVDANGESVIRTFVQRAAAFSASVIWERLPPDCWAWVHPAATDPVSLRIRTAFDPWQALNRGIFGAMGGHA